MALGIFYRLTVLEKWRQRMDAHVTALSANIATLQTEVSAVLAQLQSIQQQLSAGIDAEDAAAIAAANDSLVAVNGQLAAALAPTGTPGATGP